MKRENSAGQAAKQRGRPRAFDVDAALDKAMHVFWKNGYEGSSLEDLTAAMGINRPSLYATFGNKEELFRKAIQRYLQAADGWLRDALDQLTSRAVVETVLRRSVARPAKSGPRGCLLVHGALACSESAGAIQRELAVLRNENELILRRRFERALAENDLPKDADPAALAKYVATVQQGLAVQASGGATTRELSAAVDVAMRAWPT